MGEPFEFASEGLTWQWDTSGTRHVHGWDPATNTIFLLASGDPSEGFVTSSGVDCEGMYSLYIREMAHMFLDFNHAIPNLGPSWLPQTIVIAALRLAGAEGAQGGQSFIYDIIQNEGRDKVNGVRNYDKKYGDTMGSNGRSPIDLSAGEAMIILVQTLSADTGDDLLKRVDAAALARLKTTGALGLSPEIFAQILDDASHGHTVDGLAAGDWLLAQPFTNVEGTAGRYLALLPLNGERYLVSAFQRTVDPTDGPKETPLADLDVRLSLVDGTGAVRGSSMVPIPSDGDTLVDIPGTLGQGLPAGVYLVRAEATAGGQSLSATNVVLLGIPPGQGSLVIIPLNSDGTALRPDLVAQLQVTGAELRPTELTGVLVLFAPSGTDATVSFGSFGARLTSPEWQRPVPLRIPGT
jgi:hypothetical protein